MWNIEEYPDEFFQESIINGERKVPYFKSGPN